MARLSVIGREQVLKHDFEVQEIFTEIEGAFGKIPNLFKTYAHFPPLLKANWSKVKAVMMQGSLSRKVKESIALLVSKDNSCAYCVAAHTAALRTIGTTDKELRMIESDIVALLLLVKGFSIHWGMLAVSVGMAAGGLLNARKVAETMSNKIT